MKIVRFSKIVQESGKPEVYLLMSESDPDFNKALKAGKIMSLSNESHGSGTEYGTVGYNKNRHGQLLMFPKSLKPFSDTKIVGIKYNLFAEEAGHGEDGASPISPKSKSNQKQKSGKLEAAKKPKVKKVPKKAEPKPATKKLIPFPTRRVNEKDEEEDLRATVRQAMRVLEKGNSVAAYNILKRVVLDP